MHRCPRTAPKNRTGWRGTIMILAVAAVAPALGCPKATPDDPSVLAVFDGGEVSVRDLDRTILALPPGERQIQLQSPEQLATIVRRLAFRQVMKDRFSEEGLGDNENLRIIRDSLRRKMTAGLYLRGHFPQTPISPEEFSRWLDRHPDFRHQPPKRLVYTCFKSFSPGTPREETLKAVETIRRRVEKGEAFTQVAERESESETRHRQGLLGWISPGQVEPQLDQIIASLDEGQMSTPIGTKDGVHLFWVKTVIEGQDLSDAELRHLLLPRIAGEKREEAIGKALAELAISEPELPAPEVLQSLFQSGNPETTVLTLGNWALKLGEFQFLLQREQEAWIGTPGECLRELARTEALRQVIEQKGLLPEEEIVRRVEPELEQETLSLYVNLEMRAWLAGNEDRLRRYFESERSRFRTPLLLHVLKMTVPLGADPVRRMKELETLCADPEVGTRDLGTIAAEMDGRVENLGMIPLGRLLAREPGFLATVGLAEGALTPPHRDEAGLVVYAVLERRDPEDRPFEELREAVVETMLQERGPDLQDDFTRWVLEQAQFRLFEPRIRDAEFMQH